MKSETTPILLANTEWVPPDRLLNEVQSERMVRGLCDLIKPELTEEEVGDAEALAYIMPHTNRVPLPRDWAKIYLYLATRIIKRWNIEESLPENCRVEELTDYEINKLNELKRWIYEKRGKEYKHPVLSALKEVFYENQNLP